MKTFKFQLLQCKSYLKRAMLAGDICANYALLIMTFLGTLHRSLQKPVIETTGYMTRTLPGP